MPPLQFRPLLKRIRWGGRRLGTVLEKPIGEESDYAESWEVVDHGEDQSIICGGDLDGMTLKQLVETRPSELFGKHSDLKQFPLLFKLLDASDRLSVQVHPNDAQAKQYDPTENGKTEAWVIIDAEPNSRLYVGLKAEVTPEEVRRHLENNTVEDCLHSIEVNAGDCVSIPAGTVHAIGEGILLAEVQQSSDLTFRMYDWGRVGADGNPRELHIEQSMDCIDFDRGPVSPVIPQAVEIEGSKNQHEELVRNEFFCMRRHRAKEKFTMSVDDRFHVIMVLEGSLQLTCDDTSISMSLGQSALIPASAGDCIIVPSEASTILETFRP